MISVEVAAWTGLPARGRCLIWKETLDFNVALDFDLDLESGQIVALIHTDLASRVEMDCFFDVQSLNDTSTSLTDVVTGRLSSRVAVPYYYLGLPDTVATRIHGTVNNMTWVHHTIKTNRHRETARSPFGSSRPTAWHLPVRLSDEYITIGGGESPASLCEVEKDLKEEITKTHLSNSGTALLRAWSQTPELEALLEVSWAEIEDTELDDVDIGPISVFYLAYETAGISPSRMEVHKDSHHEYEINVLHAR
ncbi:hypothetical protein EV421DRAFT_1734783 [Armillaria borealis]|uniref:Uncharacterized protein n=1 Tax=Armillaria borealis TaxID=47425 RepID=A0AA39MT48_9AGAR|nr:hypothetical protein EV421DRAFT_1734783 [Armillaria borealis]